MPSSNICINESAIKFFGRKVNAYKLLYKLAKKGFLLYTLASEGGLVHDFVLSSSQEALEGRKDYIILLLATRTTRRHKKTT